MNRQQKTGRRSEAAALAALLTFLSLGLAGCGTIQADIGAPLGATNMTPREARQELKNAPGLTWYSSGYATGVPVTSIKVEARKDLVLLESNGYAQHFSFATMKISMGSAGDIYLDDSQLLTKPPEAAGRLAEAIGVLQRDFKSTAARGDEGDFTKTAEDYRALPTKPELPEEARRFKVQAEQAVHDKQFDDASDLYDQALAIAPWWPEGRYNRALVSSEVGDYPTAIAEMKRYLALVPEASNARAAQDRIYAWEGKVSP